MDLNLCRNFVLDLNGKVIKATKTLKPILKKIDDLQAIESLLNDDCF